MTNEKPKPDADKKLVEGKTNAKAAAKKATTNKIAKIAKDAGDQALVKMANELPGAGQAKTFLVLNSQLDKIEEQQAALNLAKRGVNGKLKEMKIEMRGLSRVRKLRKMAPEDARALKATEALYEDMFGMELSPQQKHIVEGIKVQREDARKAMAGMTGGDTGKEVGSSTGKSEPAAKTPPTDEAKQEPEKVPEKNVAIASAFKASVSTAAH